jgi:cysteinyl-tRNA synthetase
MPVIAYKKGDRFFRIGGTDWEFTDPTTKANEIYGLLPEERIRDLVAQRIEARESRDVGTADSIRSELTAHGLMVRDKGDGVSFEVLF